MKENIWVMISKQTVDIGVVGLLSGVGLEPGYYAKQRELERSRHTVIDSRSSCNSCHKKFSENKYGVYHICESCFENVHNENEMKVFNELNSIFMNPDVQKPDGHLTSIEQIDDKIYVISIDEEGCFDLIYDKIWQKKLEEKNYKIIYEFSASDGIGNPLTEWVIKSVS